MHPKQDNKTPSERPKRGSRLRRLLGSPADIESRIRAVFTASEVAAMSALRRVSLDVILATIERNDRLDLDVYRDAIRREVSWAVTAPPRRFVQAFSRKRLHAHVRRRRVLRAVHGDRP